MQSSLRSIRSTALVLSCALWAACATSHAAWQVVIVAPESVTFTYKILETGETGSFSSSQSIPLSKGQTLDFNIVAKPGFDFISLAPPNVVTGVGEFPFTSRIASAPNDRGNLKIQVKQQNPTGETTFTSGPQGSVQKIVNATGTYTFVLNCVGMLVSQTFDPAGKGDVIGTAEGVTGPGSEPMLEAVASVKTLNGTPTATYKGIAKKGSSLDGMPASGGGSGSVNLDFEGLPGEQLAAAVAGGNGIENGARYVFKKSAVEAPVSEENAMSVKRDWNVALDIFEEPDAKGNLKVKAVALLQKPGGELVYFLPTPTVYGPKGYNINFVNGYPIDSMGNFLLDTKGHPYTEKNNTKLVVKGMTFANDGMEWKPTGQGELTYQMDGQKDSKAPISEFLLP